MGIEHIENWHNVSSILEQRHFPPSCTLLLLLPVKVNNRRSALADFGRKRARRLSMDGNCLFRDDSHKINLFKSTLIFNLQDESHPKDQEKDRISRQLLT